LGLLSAPNPWNKNRSSIRTIDALYRQNTVTGEKKYEKPTPPPKTSSALFFWIRISRVNIRQTHEFIY
jgi:hypothetical protein